MSTHDPRPIPYVLGLLSDEEADAFAGELAGSQALRAQLRQAEQLVGELDSQGPLAGPQASLRETLLRSLEKDAPPEGLIRRLEKLFDLERSRVRGLLEQAMTVPAGPWEATASPGLHLLHFVGGPAVADADCGLIRLETGAAFPEHRHLGDEWAMVLQGCIAEVGGRQFDVGDLAVSATGSRHARQVVGDKAMVLAVVNFTGIEFS